MSGCFILFSTMVFIIAVKADWELSVCLGDRVESLDSDGETLSSRGLLGLSSDVVVRQTNRPDVLALDSLTGLLFLADSRRANSSIFSLKLGSTSHDPVRVVVPKASRSVVGVAYDVVDKAVYWTTGRQGSILRSTINDQGESSDAQLIHSFTAQVPHGIAVDSCRRKLYWSNCNVTGPSIETSGLDGSGRTVLVETGLFQPLGLALSQGDGFLYWADEGPGYSFTVERIRLDGTERRILVKSSHQQPISLAVVPGERVYWTDQLRQAVWKLDLPDRGTVASPVLVKEYKESVPSGLVAMKQDSKLDADVCSAVIQLKNQMKLDRWDSRPCPEDYCMNDGVCSVLEPGVFDCRCKTGYLGGRCQYETRICSAYCLDADSVTEVLYQHCRCSEVSEVYKELSSLHGSSTWRVSTICLGTVCSLLLLITVALLIRTHTLSKRPKLRRRYTVNNKGGGGKRAGRHDQSSTQCEIGDIENCCNMNVCEIPCYEAEFRTPGSNSKNGKGVEHRSLIADMEVPEPSCPPL